MRTEKRTLMSQADFARHLGLSQSAIHNWIKRKRLSPEAFIGNKIYVERAKADLALSLDTRRRTVRA